MRDSYKSLILTFTFILYFLAVADAELKLLSVVFRHGDRAPDSNGLEMYPKDPYRNLDFDPMGLGGLTNVGKLREYYIGKELRKLYGDFLGETYHKEEVSARSTNVDRTKMSLQLVLASLYPPKEAQQWNAKEDLKWQPIPSNYVPILDDKLMVPEECPKYLAAREKVENSHEFKKKLGAFSNLMTYLTQKTGKSIANSNDMYFLYHALMAEHSMKLPLPYWAEAIFPDGKLLDGILLEYKIFSYNDEMRRLNGGMLLRKFVEDMENYRNGSLDRRQKLFIYSGHETNVAAVLQALGVYKPHVPEYGSGVFVELHEKDSEYYVKVKYYKGEPGTYEEMAIPGCDVKCPLDEFKNLLKQVIPTDEDLQCDKRSLREPLQNGEIAVAGGIVKQILDSIEKEDALKQTLHK